MFNKRLMKIKAGRAAAVTQFGGIGKCNITPTVMVRNPFLRFCIFFSSAASVGLRVRQIRESGVLLFHTGILRTIQ